jgi:hypothetical protein
LENIFFKYILFCLFLLLCFACKKKTNIDVLVFNYALNEPVANAIVVLIERKLNTFSGDYSCSEIANATTNSNGECAFDEEKLRTGSKYNYYMALSNAYGQFLTYPCGGKTSGFLEKGQNTKTTIDASGFEGSLIVNINNLLSPSQLSDSLSLQITSAYFSIPNRTYPSGGGGVLNTYSYFGDIGFPYPLILISNIIKTQCGSKIVKTRKRKLGLVTSTVDTVKVYPNGTTTVTINW